jgi:hypothetical protein
MLDWLAEAGTRYRLIDQLEDVLDDYVERELRCEDDE